MSKKQRIAKKKALNSDKTAQRIAELQKATRKKPVRPAQKHLDKKKDSRYRRRNQKGYD